MDKKKIKKIICFFVGTLILAIIMNFNYIKMHYATDTYNIINVGYERYAIEWSLKDGRLFMCFIGLLANRLNMPISTYVIGLTLISIVVLCISTIRLQQIVLQYKKETSIFTEVIALLISYVTIFNFMYVENMYFVENVVMSISILIIIEAANQLIKKTKHFEIKSIILIIIAVLNYQGTIGFFFAITLVLSLLKNQDNFKQVVIDLLQSGFIALIGVLLNLLFVKIMGSYLGLLQNRIGGISSIWENIKYIKSSFLDILIENCGIFPKYLLVTFIVVTFLVGTVYSLQSKEKSNIYKMIVIILVTVLSSFVIFIMTLSSYYTGRMHFCIGSLMGLLLLFLFVKTKIFENKDYIATIMYIILLLYVACDVYNWIWILKQHKYVNELEKEQVQQIEKYITEYENISQINVDKICIIVFENQLELVYDKEIKNKSVLTYNAIRCNWASDGVINFYTKRNLKNTTISEEAMNAYIESQKEYKCIGDTLIVSTYMY